MPVIALLRACSARSEREVGSISLGLDTDAARRARGWRCRTAPAVSLAVWGVPERWYTDTGASRPLLYARLRVFVRRLSVNR